MLTVCFIFLKATKLYLRLITRNLFFYLEIFDHYRPGVRYRRLFYVRSSTLKKNCVYDLFCQTYVRTSVRDLLRSAPLNSKKPPSYSSAGVICKFITGVIFHPKFTTLQRYTYPFLPQCRDLHSETFHSHLRIQCEQTDLLSRWSIP